MNNFLNLYKKSKIEETKIIPKFVIEKKIFDFGRYPTMEMKAKRLRYKISTD